MIFYSNEYIKNLQLDSKWLESIDYLNNKWKEDESNILIFQSLSFTIWYTLSLDGNEISLTEKQYKELLKKMYEVYKIFKDKFFDNINCKWLFGYMMEVLPINFIELNLDFEEISNMGKKLIASAAGSGNIIAEIFNYDKRYYNKNKLKFLKLKRELNLYFDENQIIDNYFIGIINMNLNKIN